MNGEGIAFVGIGIIGEITEENFSDYEYEIIEDGIVVGEETVIDEETGEENTVPVTKDAVKIIKYNGSATIVVIPAAFGIDDLYVIEIADGAFKNNATLETVYIPKWIKTVGNEAFAGCEALKEIIFENTAYTLPEDAPEGSVAGELTIGEDVLKDSPNAVVYAASGSYVSTVAKDLGWTYSNKIPDHTPEAPVDPETPVDPEGGEETPAE